MRIHKGIMGVILACALSAGAFAERDSRTVTQSAGVGGRYDQDILKSVEKTLGDHSEFKNVSASVNDGEIVLSGTVKLLANKNELEKKMRSKDHVATVRDLVEVEGNVPDAELREKLAKKLRYDREGYGVVFNSFDLGVQNGVVTLLGSTRDPISKDSAISEIEHTAGVKGLVEQVKVEPPSPFDDELRLRLVRAIYRDPMLSQFAIDPQAPIRIAVDHGNVTLSGVVDTTAQKNVAEIRAKGVPGVFSVTDNIMVEGQRR